jgi:opacity protein-like surface antigen
MNTNRGSYLLGAALGSALVLALCAPVMAADIYDGGLKGGYDVPPPPSDRGIYIKGYIGQANPDVGDIWTEGFDGSFNVHHKDIKSSPLFGLGIGWQARHWLRFDLTGEYRGDATFLGQDTYGNFGPGANEYTADVKSWLGLANAYIDMGNWCGFTPFIGAGIGFASISVEGMRDDGINSFNPGFPNSPSVGYGADKTSTNFAYAFYAGTSFDVSPQVTLDLTYRWANLGSATSGVVTAYDGSGSISGVQIKDITSNDVMLGVRYKLQREAVVYQPVK